jgi:hypothetical protein
MDPAQQRLIAALHAAPTHCVLALTGGGASAVSALLSVPGASRTVLDALIPYHDNALRDFLGVRPKQFCSLETAQALARRAFERAERLAPGEPIAGLGCTATLATDRPKRGEHRFHLSLVDDQRMLSNSLILTKGARDRAGEEQVVSYAILNALAEVFGVPDRLDLPLMPGEQPQVSVAPAGGLLAALLRGEMSVLCQEIDGRQRANGPTPPALLCGSFNPLHAAHLRLAEFVAHKFDVSAAFELGVTNADKPSLTAAEVRQRLRQFVWRAPVWLSRAPTFVEKAAHFPGTMFVVGSDTAERIVASKFYGDSVDQMREALVRLRVAGCRFIVAGRTDSTGRFVAPEAVSVPEEFRDLFVGIPEAEFRSDLSSTELRGRATRT